MREWYASLFNTFAATGLVAFMITPFTEGQTAFGSYVAGYVAFILALLIIMLIIVTNLLAATAGKTAWEQVSGILSSSGSYFGLLGLLGFILYLLVSNQSKIVSGHVAPGFTSFNWILIMLVLLQFYTIYSGVSSANFEFTKRLSRVANSILWLLCTFSWICAYILYVILMYYSTDG